MSKRFTKIMFVWCMSFALLVGGLSLGAPKASAATVFSNVSANTTTPAQYDKYELDFDLSSTYANPYNPDEVDIRAYFLTPSGQTEVVPGFYNKSSSPKWAVRYAPRLIGNYSVYIKVTDGSGVGQSATYTFTSGGPGTNRGFMGVSGNRFVDSFGKQLTLIGTNYAWGTPSEILTAMPQYKAAKMNIMRVWQSVWWGNYALEWGPTVTTQNGITMNYEGIGKYQNDNLARTDTLIETAAANNIYVMLTVNSFGDFYYDWPQNAYNTANGGPASWSENNTNFWTNATAIDYQKKLLRYTFARWGYSRGLGMLEYWNESDNRVDTDATTRGNWHTTVDNYWKSWDFYDRPTTTSFAWKDHVGFGQTTWSTLPTMDTVNLHDYNTSANAMDNWELNIKNMLSTFGNRPAFIGEVGKTGGDQTSDPQMPNFVHDSVWGPVFRAGAAGTSLWWIFETGFNVPANYKAIYTAFANFIQPEEQYLPSEPFVDYGAQANSTKVGAFKNGDRGLLWINNTTATYNVTNPSTISGMSFTLPGMNNGTYDITYFNTVTGTNISTTTATVSTGSLVISSIPSFTRDIAIKVVRQGSGVVDTQVPTVPTNLTSPSKTDLSVNLSWSGSTDNVGVTGYDIYRGATLAGSTAGGTTFVATGLTANTAYSFTVKAKDSAGNISAASTALSVTTNPPDTTAPTAPSGLTSPSKLDVSVNLSWTASTDNVGVTAYDVYRNGSLVGSSSGTVTVFTATGLTASTAYTFTVKARDAASNVSAASNSLSVTTMAPIAQNMLQNPGFETDDGYGSVNQWTCEQTFYCSRDTSIKRTGNSSLRWSGSSGAWFGTLQDVAATAGTTYTFDGYVNITATTGELNVKLQFLNSAGTIIADNNSAIFTAVTAGWVNVHGAYVAPAGTAKVRVYPYIRGLNGTMYFDDFSVTGGSGGGDTTAPTAPTGLTSPSKTATSVNLSWTASTDNVGVVGYDIYNGVSLAGTTTGATTITISGLTASTAYSFTVKARDAASNTSVASNALSVTTNASADTTAPSAPAGLTSPAKTTTSVSLSWTASTDNVAVTGYDIYRGATLAGSTTGATTYTVTGLTANTAYSFTVKAKDAAGNISVASSALSITTNAVADTTAPSAPTALNSPSKTSTMVTLSWTASTDNVSVTGYDVYRGATLAGSTVGAATTFTASGLTPSTAYSFTVKAKDAANNISAASSALSVTTNAASVANLLINPGFETLAADGKPDTWICEQTYYCYTDTAIKRSGTRSLRIDGNSGPWFAVYQAVSGTPAKIYTFDGYLNIVSNNGSKIDIKVQFLNSAGSVIGDNLVTSFDGTTTSGFVNLHGAYTAPANTATVRVFINFTNMRAVMYFDDMSLTSN
ncbi:DUF5060 domain-containing protein [Paenibacillus psychroresistens]|uniref:DUF5060 domain-containing protein n=1 Tax=Paenibacillus psychroresistens TaxID=1778678 RepID=A0A6B8RJG6_9BACL|nr:fibronectin type III domain-containing protein [Paenibacillus psychroresistens]QGQ95536.1 DUF5060 domain-containing protein [Paenibacillus psychroresistens]